MVKISLKNHATAVTSNQRPNGHLVLSQYLILPLLTVKQTTFCKQIEEKINNFVFFYLKNAYF